MKFFIVYDTSTGEIQRAGSCQDDLVPDQAFLPNEAAIEGEADPLSERIDLATGLIVPSDNVQTAPEKEWMRQL
ncbi:MAG TPA: hypothetical protein PLT33_11865 [Deltaproteobacteria bacterium]|jgi:hypothetical protein|nr:hypothetical protein [Deltaproteobacteria bacterium]HQO61555.1 hypothetical protein [Deltaproteobacteria bacterium]